jgi:RNA polymerase sigma factor (sigma-70 family)
MTEHEALAERFQGQRGHLQAVAYRMLGSLSEAEDAVQEAWLRLERTDAGGVQNLAAWLTTVVSRVCLDLLRSRAARREDLAGHQVPEEIRNPARGVGDPEQEAVLADEVGRALLVVLDTLGPAERIAFVLHDMFTVPFDEIAPIVGRSPVTTKKLASRARSGCGAPRRCPARNWPPTWSGSATGPPCPRAGRPRSAGRGRWPRRSWSSAGTPGSRSSHWSTAPWACWWPRADGC